jgi:hypothetical protein
MYARKKDVLMLNASSDSDNDNPYQNCFRSLVVVWLLVLLEQSLFFGGGKHSSVAFFPSRTFTLNGVSPLLHFIVKQKKNEV